MQSTIAVTGSSGGLGRVLVRRLLRDPAVDRVVALDRVPAPIDDPRVTFHACDVRDPGIVEHLRGCGAVVHLAFVIHRQGQSERELDDVNIGGTENVARATARAGASQLVYASSVAAYGFHADNWHRELDEDAPIRGDADFFYTRAKAACERFLAGFSSEHPGISVARMRPCTWLGSASHLPWVWRKQPFMPYFTFGDPPQQLVHISDVAEAFYLALARGARGGFNVATDDALRMREFAGQVGKRRLPVPGAALSALSLGYRVGVLRSDPIWFRMGARAPIVVSSRKIRRVLRWKPRYDSAGCVLREALGCPTALASPAVKWLLGGLATVTAARGSLPASPRETMELAHTSGTCNLMLSGQRASEWHVAFENGSVGLHPGLSGRSRATVIMAESVFLGLVLGQLDWSTCTLTGKVRIRGETDHGILIGGIISGIARALSANHWPVRLLQQALRAAGPS